MFSRNHGLAVSQMNGDVRTDHVLGYEEGSAPLGSYAIHPPASAYEEVEPAHQQVRTRSGMTAPLSVRFAI